MLRTRIIPALLLNDESLVKTSHFDKFTYVGDPCNTVRIFNELEVDELLFLDITATKEKRPPNYKVLHDIASECFMPLAYGGGVCEFNQAKKIFEIGIEKIAINSHVVKNTDLLTKLSEYFGAQAIISSIDVRKDSWGKYEVWTHGGSQKSGHNPVEWAQEVVSAGAGEILLTSINREGSWEGFDLDLVKSVTDAVNVPVIAHGGAGRLEHISDVIKQGQASAVALGSMVVFQKKGMGVLVNFPEEEKINLYLDGHKDE